MKLKKYLPFVALAALLASCAEEPELPPVNGPQATYESNMDILTLKQTYWSTDKNYVNEIGLNADGDSIIIHGTVISSDETGNIYKSLMINDGTAALTVAVSAYDLFETYQYGQEIFINVSGLHIGGYNGLMQLGGEGTYNNSPSMTFMDEDVMTAHAQQNGWASKANAEQYIIDVNIETLNTAKASVEGLQNWQSQLVRISDVTFENAGAQFAPTSTTDRYIKDADGNSINVRCSSYSDFHLDTIPSGTGSVTAILSYYGSNWQLLLIDLEGLQGFDEVGGDDSSDDNGDDNSGDETGDDNNATPAEPAEGEAKFVRATEIVSGEQYVLWAENTVSNPMDSGKSYSYMYVTDGVTPDADNSFVTDVANAYTFTEYADGWTIQDSNGVYLYQSGTYTSFQLSSNFDSSNSYYYWTITATADGNFEIVNNGNNQLVQYSASYTSYGCYSDKTKGSLPYLYQLVK